MVPIMSKNPRACNFYGDRIRLNVNSLLKSASISFEMTAMISATSMIHLKVFGHADGDHDAWQSQNTRSRICIWLMTVASLPLVTAV